MWAEGISYHACAFVFCRGLCTQVLSLSILPLTPPQSSVDVTVWNTQWLLGTLMGADHSRVTDTQPATIIEEVNDEDLEV